MAATQREPSKVIHFFKKNCYQYADDHTFTFLVEEILNFNQADLVTEDVMLMDTGETLFVWLGNDSNQVKMNDGRF